MSYRVRMDTNGPNALYAEFWKRPSDAVDSDIDTIINDFPLAFQPEPEQVEGSPLDTGPGAWVVSRPQDILEMSKNPQIFSSAEGITFFEMPPGFDEFFSSMIAMDDPRNAKIRRLISAGFTPRMLDRLSDSVQLIATDIVDGICEQGEIDFVVDVAAAFPLRIVCELMGIPDKYFDLVFDSTNKILGGNDPEYIADEADFIGEILGAGVALAGIMEEVAADKKGGDGTDLTSLIVNADLEDDQMEHSDLASFFILLAVAGNETTRNAISWGLKFLTDNPDQRKIWTDDFEGVAPSAIDEIVRLASPVTYMRRTATQDTVLNGQEIAAGDKLAMYYLIANRDPQLFKDPHSFDILRSPNPHVGFGGPGPHFCLGAHLARREITVMFRELFTRLPDIEATGDPDLLFSSFIHGIKHLPASFTPTSPS